MSAARHNGRQNLRTICRIIACEEIELVKDRRAIVGILDAVSSAVRKRSGGEKREESGQHLEKVDQGKRP